MNITLRFLTIVAWLAAGLASAGNGPLYSSLGPGLSYDANGVNYFDGLGGGTLSEFHLGTLFTAAGTGPLAQVLVPTSNANGTANFALYAANGTCVPGAIPGFPDGKTCTGTLGTLLESWSNVLVPANNLYQSTSDQPRLYAIPKVPLTVLISFAHPMLTAGNQYWFVVSPGPLSNGLCPSGQQALETGINLNGPFPGTTCDAGGGELTKAVIWENADQGTGGMWQTGKAGANSYNTRVRPPALELDAYVAYYFPHLAVGGGWQSTLTYVNYSPQSISCHTTFYSDAGEPLPVPFSGDAVATRDDDLAPGASLHVQTQAPADAALLTGWAQAQCTGPVKASLLFRWYIDGVAHGEAGVSAMTLPATEFVSFAETQTGLAYANPSPSPATVNIAALDSSGHTLGAKTLTLQPNQHGAANIGPLLGLSSFTGSVQITSTMPLVALLLNFEAAPVFSSLPPAGLPAGTRLAAGDGHGAASASSYSSTYYFPHLAVGDGWQTTFTYVNYSAQSVSCRTTFYSDSGAALQVPFAGGAVTSRVDNLAPGAGIHVPTQAALNAALLTGWASAQCTGPVKASLLFRWYIDGVAHGEAGVSAMTAPAGEFASFAQSQTGIAYANPSTSPATVAITAFDQAGLVLGAKNIILQPNQHGAANIAPLLGLTGFTGSVLVTSSAPIVALLLNFEAAPVFSSLPPADLPAQTPLFGAQP